ncbi:hypothetical protein GJ744_011868 [Endocarpon pusillum]|uniref:Uncharacterized protein n=1 Tax=Endocarpon pusillum TaxID=364733 RepID=A0A8H7ABW6_9EURO|nr:hypothetical protein GJ744_011868 [Endocarpon pusillum]
MLVHALYDSLVDQAVQHRFLTVREQPERLIPLLVYVIHPESTACLRNHILHNPQFLCQKGNTWIASITLRSWLRSDKGADASATKSMLVPKLPSDDDLISFPEEPTHAKSWYEENRNSNKNQMPDTFRRTISSIILSTNVFGDFSKCTIISEDISEDNLVTLVDASRTVWQKFIHQPQTARCLVFLLALGMMCSKLHCQYTNAIDQLASFVDFTTVFLSQEEWSEDHTSFRRFKLGLWSLDSLYRLQKSLKASVDSLLEAKEELMQQINDGPGKRSELLQRMCQEYLGEFESNLLGLTRVNTEWERKIELHSRYNDALSAVLGLRDSRASLQQNSTIQKLTYLTIVYLPIGLMAAIFAIPNEQRVAFEGMGRGWFVGCILLMSAATYTLAIYIQNVLTFISRLLGKICGMSPRFVFGQVLLKGTFGKDTSGV